MRIDKRGIIIGILIIAVIISLGFNINQRIKIKEYRKSLANEVRENLQRFAGKASNSYDKQEIYAELYANIELAFNSFCILEDGKSYSEEEYDESLAKLLLHIKLLMLNDKEKVEMAFENGEGSRLMFKISDNFNDKESIKKLIGLLKLE